MISKKMEDALNGQINKEMFSAYLYLSMSSYAEIDGFKGIATWFKVQYHEEMVHAMKFFEYIISQGGTVSLSAIEQPQTEFQSPLHLFEKALEHERFVTKCINELADEALSEKDHATKIFIDWFVTEQIEEEKNATEIIQTLKMIGDNKAALFLYDKDLGTRTVTVPTDFSKGVEAQLAGKIA
jgi:ferritin